MPRVGRAIAASVLGAAAVVAARVGGRALVGLTERRLCPTVVRPPYLASDRAHALHEQLFVADLHADSLLWGRDLLKRAAQGQVDVPRLIEGNVALQVLAAPTKSPRHLNIERNDDRSDDIIRNPASATTSTFAGSPSRAWAPSMARRPAVMPGPAVRRAS